MATYVKRIDSGMALQSGDDIYLQENDEQPPLVEEPDADMRNEEPGNEP